MKKFKNITNDLMMEYIDKLYKGLNKYISSENLKIDYVVPNLRSGAVPAVYLANKLNIVKFAPIQVKYVNKENVGCLDILYSSFESLKIEKENPSFLVVEGMHDTGDSIKIVLDELKRVYPKSRILYVSLVKTYGSQSFDKIVEYEDHAYIRASENMSDKDCKKLGLDNAWPIFPWETEQDQTEHLDDLVENIYF